MRWDQSVEYASITDVGLRRRNNQDAISVQICSDRERWECRGHLFVVADGMGGHAVGELASKIATDTLPHTYFKDEQTPLADCLRESIEAANRAIYERGSHNREFERMGTTCSALSLSPEGAVVGHVGDSRVYRIRSGRIEQLTFDHSLQWELIRQGRMKTEDILLHQPRNVITRSLGPEPTVNVDMEGPLPVHPGDSYVLCSDGLTGHVADAEIGAIAASMPPAESCRLLVNLANLRGGSDNISVVVAHVGAAGGAVLDAAPRPAAVDSNVSWLSWLLAFGLAAMIALGVSLALLQYRVAGIGIAGCGILGLSILAMHWFRERPRPVQQAASPSYHWRPYRVAKARLTKKFLSDLIALEGELEQSALDEGWSIDWDVYRVAEHEAKRAVASAGFADAFRAYARMLDVFMASVHEQRRQRDREAKWGSGSPSS